MAGNRLQYLSANDWTLIKAARRIFKLGEEIIKQGAKQESIFIIRRAGKRRWNWRRRVPE